MSAQSGLSSYRYQNPQFATLLFNTMNGMCYTAAVTTDDFLASMKDLYYSQLYDTEVIAIVTACIFLALVCVQVPTGYALTKIVRGQIDIFLRLPNHDCAKLARAANDFVLSIQAISTDNRRIEQEIRCG